MAQVLLGVADWLDRQYEKRTDAIIMRDAAPETLQVPELDLATQTLTRTPKPIPAKAWVRYGTIPLQLDVEIVAWTPRAVAVRWTTPAGREDRAWVWAYAVERTLDLAKT